MNNNPIGNSQTPESTLLELYKMAFDMDKYELDLGWKLVQFYTALNSGLLSIGFGLLGSDQFAIKIYIIPLFLIGFITSVIAILSRIRYHKHSLRAEYKRILIESELGLDKKFEKKNYKEHTLAIATTSNINKAEKVLSNPDLFVNEGWKRWWTVPFYHHVIFVAFVLANITGAILCLSVS